MRRQNSFEGVAEATAVTTGNSGGPSGDPFDVVVGTVLAQSSAAMVGERGAVPALASSAECYVAWDVTGTTHWLRDYVQIPAGQPTHNMRLIRGMSAGTIVWELRFNLSFEFDLMVAGAQRFYLGSPDADGDWNLDTTYRLELAITAAGVDLDVYAGDATTALASQSWAGTVGAIDQVRFGVANSTAMGSSSRRMDGLGWSDTAALGPYVAAEPPQVGAGLDQTVEPWTTVTVTATSDAGVTWTQVDGPAVTLAGSGLTRTFTAPPDLAGAEVVLRATATNEHGSSSDDTTITVLPATDALMTPGGLVPMRLRRGDQL